MLLKMDTLDDVFLADIWFTMLPYEFVLQAYSKNFFFLQR